jgi:hypothetical protein
MPTSMVIWGLVFFGMIGCFTGGVWLVGELQRRRRLRCVALYFIQPLRTQSVCARVWLCGPSLRRDTVFALPRALPPLLLLTAWL